MSHANIVKLKEVIRENDILYFVFEYMVGCLDSVVLTLVFQCYLNRIMFILYAGMQPIPTHERQGKAILGS